MIFDTHAHPYLSKEKPCTEILEEIQRTGIPRFLLSVWVDIPSSQTSLDLAEKYDFIFASVGIYPWSTLQYAEEVEETFEKFESLLTQKKVVAIGECGLDYYRLPPRIESKLSTQKIQEIQALFFRKQIQLAKKYSFPLIIHNRDAKDDTLKILKEEDCKNFTMHSYSEDIEFAEKLLSFAPDCLISFSWIVTFKSAKAIAETAAHIPLRNIIIETDSPYLTPTPLRGKENYPSYARYTLDAIIALRSEEREIIEKQIFENSLRVFWVSYGI